LNLGLVSLAIISSPSFVWLAIISSPSLVSLTIISSPELVYDFWMLSTKHLLVCFKKCYFHAIYPLGFQTLFNRGDLDRPTSQCCSTHVTDFEDFGSGELRPKPSPSDLKNTLFFRAPILKGKSHSITFPNRQRMPKISVFPKI